MLSLDQDVEFDYVLYLFTGLLLYFLLNDHSLHRITICLRKVNQKQRDSMYENLLKILPNSEKFCKIWKILKAVLMQACDLEYLENLKYLEDFAFLCKILHDNAGLYKILQNFEMRVFLMNTLARLDTTITLCTHSSGTELEKKIEAYPK